MALPVILINSATGSDSAASGAGPATALTGTAASTDGTGLVVTLDGSPDLSGVATDGSHVIYLADTTASARNFGKITAKDNTAKTVTVSNAFGLSLSGKSWAIGGKRASIGSTTSVKLFNNNTAAGDAMPGWTIRMESGHTETYSGIRCYRNGDTTDGPIVIEGEENAATVPAITNNTTTISFSLQNTPYVRLKNFEIVNSHATGPSEGIHCYANSTFGTWQLEGIKITGKATSALIRAQYNNSCAIRLRNCFVDNTGSGYGFYNGSAASFDFISHCYFRARSNRAVYQPFGVTVYTHCIFDRSTWGLIANDSGSAVHLALLNCVFRGHSSGGLQLNHVSANHVQIVNCDFSEITGYAIDFTTSSTTDLTFAQSSRVLNCNYYNCSSGFTDITPTLTASGTTNLDPQYTDATNLNFTIGTNLKAIGYSTSNILGTLTRNYMDVGAAQRQEAGGGGILVHSGMSGGIRG